MTISLLRTGVRDSGLSLLVCLQSATIVVFMNVYEENTFCLYMWLQ